MQTGKLSGVFYVEAVRNSNDLVVQKLVVGVRELTGINSIQKDHLLFVAPIGRAGLKKISAPFFFLGEPRVTLTGRSQ